MNFRVSGIIVIPSGLSIPPFEMKTSRPAERKVMGTESKKLATGPLGVIMSGVTPVSTP